MMIINRENYEVWFIDYLDGKLDREALAQLQGFLQSNPDLEKELKDFDEVNLNPVEMPYLSANKLFKTESDLIDISRTDYLLIKQMEQGLSGDEDAELSKEIKSDESLIKRGLQFQNTRLFAKNISYTHKGALLHRSVAFLYPAVKIAAAVIVVALLLTIWNNDFFFASQRKEVALQRLPSLPVFLEEKEFSVPDPVVITLGPIGVEEHPRYYANDISSEREKEQELSSEIKNLEVPMERLISNVLEEGLSIEFPNAYETGLRHMMPMYLDINRNRGPMLVNQSLQPDSPSEENFLMKGIQFVDRVSGDLVNFDKLYDEDGNFVAYNLKAGYIEVEQKLRR